MPGHHRPQHNPRLHDGAGGDPKGQVALDFLRRRRGITAPAKDRFWVFKTAQTDQMAVSRIYQYCQKHGITKVAILTVSTGFGVAGKEQLLAQAAQVWHRSGGPGSLRG